MSVWGLFDKTIYIFYKIMAEPRSNGSMVRYYCTAGNGMEPFLIDEVKMKLSAEDVSVVALRKHDELLITPIPQKTGTPCKT